MTRNIYQGTSFDDVVAATTPIQLLIAAGQAVQNIRNSKPRERAAAVALEIFTNRVDLVSLQEAVILRTGPSQLAGPFSPATIVESDGLELLLDELERLGQPYHVVAIAPGIDAQLPTLLGIDARLTVRSVIIARSRSQDLKLSNVQVQGFLMNRSFPVLGGSVANSRGWASVDVQKGNRKFRFAATHLEQPHAVQAFQAYDMIKGAGGTAMPVIFAGDFNVTSTTIADPTYAQLVAAGFVDAWALKHPSASGYTCCQDADLLNAVSNLTERIDLVLFRGAFRVDDVRIVGDNPADRTVSRLWPSDHAGVVATLRMH